MLKTYKEGIVKRYQITLALKEEEFEKAQKLVKAKKITWIGIFRKGLEK